MARAILDIIEYKENNKKFKSFLEFLNESNNNLANEISLYFNKRKKDENSNVISLSDKDIKFIIKLLNKYLFDNKLKNIKIKIDTLDNITQFVKNSYNSNGLIFNGFKKNFVALCHGIVKNDDEQLMKIVNPNLIKIENKIILVNKDYIKNSTILDIMDYIAHEMIHYYDFQYGTYRIEFLYSFKKHKDFNSHTTETFNQYRNKANKLGLNITDETFIESEDIKHKCDYDKDVIYLDHLIITMSKDRKRIAFLEFD